MWLRWFFWLIRCFLDVVNSKFEFEDILRMVEVFALSEWAVSHVELQLIDLSTPSWVIEITASKYQEVSGCCVDDLKGFKGFLWICEFHVEIGNLLGSWITVINEMPFQMSVFMNHLLLLGLTVHVCKSVHWVSNCWNDLGFLSNLINECSVSSKSVLRIQFILNSVSSVPIFLEFRLDEFEPSAYCIFLYYSSVPNIHKGLLVIWILKDFLCDYWLSLLFFRK